MVIAANHTISTLRIVAHVYNLIRDLPVGSTVRLRRPRTSNPGIFEKSTALMAESAGMLVEWYAPEAGGREQTYLRDYAMVTGADRVECFFNADTPMEGGTAHVVEAAITRSAPVFAWAMDEHGQLERLGEHEPLFS